MKTALLVCDHVLSQFQEEHGAYPEMFDKLFPDLDLVPYFVCDGNFPDVHDFDAFIISGSKYSVYDDIQWILDLKVFTVTIFNSNKKLLGVCFGHQMIAEALGGKVEKAANGFLIGLHIFELLQKEPWMNPYQSPYTMLMLCQDQVAQLPPGSRVLSKAEGCSVAMFSIEDRILGIQGHPEFTKEYNRTVFESRIEKIGQDKIDQAIESLELATDSSLLRKYLTGFLASPNPLPK